MAIGDSDGEIIGPVGPRGTSGRGIIAGINGRGVGEPTIGVNHHAALGGGRRPAIGQDITISIGSGDRASHHPCGGIRSAYRRSPGHRVGVGRTDRHSHHRSRGTAKTIGHGHGEAVGEIGSLSTIPGGGMASRGCRGVGEPTIGVDHHAALRGGGRTTEGQGVTISISGRHSSDDHTRRSIRGSHNRGPRHRGSVDRTDRNVDSGGRGAAVPVSHSHGEAVSQIDSYRTLAGRLVTSRLGRGVGELAIGVDHHTALRGGGRTTEGQGITVGIGGAHRTDDHAGQFIRAAHHRDARDRRGVRGTDRNRDHRSRCAALRVSDGHGEAV